MSDRSRVVAASIVGAVVGGVAGYLLFTRRGRRMRAELEPALDHVARELMNARGTALAAAGVAVEAWRLFNEISGERHGRSRR